MLRSENLIPARFLTLLSHLCVAVTLLWESQQTVRYCLPSQYHNDYLQIYHNRLVAGLATSITLTLVEMATFLSGLTMFHPGMSLLSVACHGSASVALTYFVLGGWLCDWFWWIFVTCDAVPCVANMSTTNELQHLTKTNEYKGGWSFYLALAAGVTTLGLSLPVGYNIGVVNTPAEVIKSFCNESIISRYGVELEPRWLEVVWASVVSVFIVGGCTGSVLAAVLANKLGRKMACIVTGVVSLAGAALFAACRAANSVEMLVLGRLLVGLSGGLTTSIVPMYLSEVSPLSLAGAMGSLCPLGVNVGVFVGQVMGLDFLLGAAEDWPYLLSAYSILVIICVPILFLLPESPKYLFVIKRDEGTALKELSRLRGVSPSLLQDDIDLLREELAASEAAAEQSWGMWRVATSHKLMLPLLLICSMQAGQQTSGINAVFYYSQKIFIQAGLSPYHAQLSTIACGFINVCTAVVVARLLPSSGRRPLLLGSTAAAACMLAALAASMLAIESVSWMPYVCTVCVILYVFCYGFGLGPIPYFIASELLEVAPRGGGMSWGSLANWGGNLLVGMLFPTMRAAIGPYSFIVFAVITALLLVFLKIYFPETKGKTPAQVALLLEDGFKSRPLRSAVVENTLNA